MSVRIDLELLSGIEFGVKLDIPQQVSLQKLRSTQNLVTSMQFAELKAFHSLIALGKNGELISVSLKLW